MTDTKTELPIANTEKPAYYVDIGNNTWIDNMGQKYTLSELATAIKKREQEEVKQNQAGLKTVLVEQGNTPVVVPTPAPVVVDRPDVLMIFPQIDRYHQNVCSRGRGLDALDRLMRNGR